MTLIQRIAGSLVLMAVCVGLWSCRGASSGTSPPRLVLLYAPCTVSKGFLSLFNREVSFTPRLEALRSRALAFPRHQTESGQSGVAYASLFSGLQADRHGIYSHPTVLSDEVVLVTEAFRDAGYEPFSWLAHGNASARLNYAQGVAPSNQHDEPLQADASAFREILERLKEDPGYKAFVVTNFLVTHGPYRGALLEAFAARFPGEAEALADRAEFETYRQLYYRDYILLIFDLEATREKLGLSDEDVSRLAAVIELLYRADIYLLDRMFGAVLDAIEEFGLTDSALVAFTADHGETMYRENQLLHWTHGLQLAPEVLGVPLVLLGGGVRAGTYPQVTRSIDVLPTLAGLSGVELPHVEGRGVDLSAAVRGEAPPPELPAFSHTALLDEAVWRRYRTLAPIAAIYPELDPAYMGVAVRKGDRVFKLMHRPGATSPEDSTSWLPEVYDLASDPGETRNLYGPEQPEHRAAVAELHAYKQRLVDVYAGADRGIPQEEALKVLRRLGYIR